MSFYPDEKPPEKRLIVYQTSERQDQWEGDLLNEFMQTYAKDAYWVKADLVDKLFWISFCHGEKGAPPVEFVEFVKWEVETKCFNGWKWYLPSPVTGKDDQHISGYKYQASFLRVPHFVFTLFSALLITVPPTALDDILPWDVMWGALIFLGRAKRLQNMTRTSGCI